MLIDKSFKQILSTYIIRPDNLGWISLIQLSIKNKACAICLLFLEWTLLLNDAKHDFNEVEKKGYLSHQKRMH